MIIVFVFILTSYFFLGRIPFQFTSNFDGTQTLAPPGIRSSSNISNVVFEKISEDTLESLCEKFEELNELPSCPSEFDVSYAAGVLTAKISHGKSNSSTRTYLHVLIC